MGRYTTDLIPKFHIAIRPEKFARLRSPAHQLLAEEDRGQDGTTPFGVGLEVSGPLAVAGGQSQQPQDERSQGGDEQQGLEALGVSRVCVAQCEPESVALERMVSSICMRWA